MHRTHQCYKKIWAQPLPNAHPVWQLEEWATTSETKKNKNIKPNVKINIMDEGYALQDEGYA
jgi:hypothetical protein